MQLTNSILVLGATASVAFAQSMSTTSSAMTPQQTCLSTCNLGDVNCQAACLGNPYPNASDANATTECSKKCVQGNGTKAETEAYAMCLQRCRTSFFPVGTGVYNGPTAAPSVAAVTGASMSVGATTPMETGSSSGSSSGSGSNSGSSGSQINDSNGTGSDSASASMSPSPSMSGSAAQQTGAAGVNSVAVSSFSLAALVAAVFAL